MNIARPETGFKLSFVDSGERDLAVMREQGLLGSLGWNAVEHVLRWNAHKVGHPAPELGAGTRYLRMYEASSTCDPSLHVAYLVLGDQVYVKQFVKA